MSIFEVFFELKKKQNLSTSSVLYPLLETVVWVKKNGIMCTRLLCFFFF